MFFTKRWTSVVDAPLIGMLMGANRLLYTKEVTI